MIKVYHNLPQKLCFEDELKERFEEFESRAYVNILSNRFPCKLNKYLENIRL